MRTSPALRTVSTWVLPPVGTSWRVGRPALVQRRSGRRATSWACLPGTQRPARTATGRGAPPRSASSSSPTPAPA